MPRHSWSTRNCKGKGWGKKGYRQHGEVCIMLKHNFADFSRGWWINENSSISELISDFHRHVQGGDGVPPPIHLRLYFRRKVLTPSDDVIKTIMDGGETVYAKAFDDDDQEYNTDGSSWCLRSERKTAGVKAFMENMKRDYPARQGRSS